MIETSKLGEDTVKAWQARMHGELVQALHQRHEANYKRELHAGIQKPFYPHDPLERVGELTAPPTDPMTPQPMKLGFVRVPDSDKTSVDDDTIRRLKQPKPVLC